MVNHADDILLLLRGELNTVRNIMPFRQTAPATGGGGMLGDKYRVTAHGRLFAVIRGLCRGRRFEQQNQRHADQWYRLYPSNTAVPYRLSGSASETSIAPDGKKGDPGQTSVNGTSQALGQLLQNRDTGKGISRLIQLGAPDGNRHLMRYNRHHPPPTPDLAGRPTRQANSPAF